MTTRLSDLLIISLLYLMITRLSDLLIISLLYIMINRSSDLLFISLLYLTIAIPPQYETLKLCNTKTRFQFFLILQVSTTLCNLLMPIS